MSGSKSTNSASRQSKGVPPRPLLTALMSETRWKMLAEMATGELFTVRDLAARVGETEGSASKHLLVLRNARITEFGPGRLHRLTPAYVCKDDTREIDFGYMVIRLPQVSR